MVVKIELVLNAENYLLVVIVKSFLGDSELLCSLLLRQPWALVGILLQFLPQAHTIHGLANPSLVRSSHKLSFRPKRLPTFSAISSLTAPNVKCACRLYRQPTIWVNSRIHKGFLGI